MKAVVVIGDQAGEIVKHLVQRGHLGIEARHNRVGPMVRTMPAILALGLVPPSQQARLELAQCRDLHSASPVWIVATGAWLSGNRPSRRRFEIRFTFLRSLK